MQNEKQNKHIQQTVGELQQLPDGFAFNSQKVWGGLEQQLPGRQQKKVGWYYVAAAVLSIACTTYFVFSNKAKHLAITQAIVNPVTAPLQGIASLPVPQQKNKKESSIKISHTVKQTIKTNVTVLPEQKEVAGISMQPPEPVATQVEQTVTITLPAEKINKEEKKIVPVTAGKPLPKYRIVHLNELDQSPAPVNNSLTRSELKRNSQQHTDEKEITPLVENSRQLLYFKIKPITTISIVEN